MVMNRIILIIILLISLFSAFKGKAETSDIVCQWEKPTLALGSVYQQTVCGLLEIKQEPAGCRYMRSVLFGPEDPWYRVVPGHLYQLRTCEFQLEENGTITERNRTHE
jgi:hypothetical protein